MKETEAIIKAFDSAVAAGKKCAIVTVIHVDGSSYRRPGARMLVTDDGQLTGAISGGCLEGDALRKAMLVLKQQQSKLVTYDTNDEDDAIIGVQLGCSGIINVLFEPINITEENNPVQLLRKAWMLQKKAALITLFSLKNKKALNAGTCILIEENGTISGSSPYPEITGMIEKDAVNVIKKQLSSFETYKTNTIPVNAFIEFLQPPVSLVIIGAGNDAMPLMRIADILGWNVIVADGRSTHAKQDRFERACQIIVSKPEKVLEEIRIDANTVFVLMTHNYNYDKAMLRILLQKNLRYIGMLGPKSKVSRMLNELGDEGIELTQEQLNRIYSPAGLELNAETAEEIALSIIAEITAVLSGKTANSLRNKIGPIHQVNMINNKSRIQS
jgi:xanthine/CO dehydrogenase XdhC/CoxF family maturation factor